MAVETQIKDTKPDFTNIKGNIRVIFYEEIAPSIFRYKGEKRINSLRLIDNQVHFKKRSFVIDTAFISTFDKVGLPVIEYDINTGTPLHRKLEHTDNNYTKIPSSKIWYAMFKMQKYRALLSSVSKEKAPAPWYIYVLLGAMIGAVAIIIAYPYIFPNEVVHTLH